MPFAGPVPARRFVPGIAGLAAILAVVASAGVGLAAHASGRTLAGALSDGYVIRVAGFTVFQAGLSTLLSVMLAIPFARAAHRRRHLIAVRAMLALASLAFVTPVIIGVFGIVELHGRAGWVHQGAAMLGLDPGSYIYGLTGILIAHLFFNMPFAARNMVHALDGVTPETWRLAAQLGFNQRQIFRLIEWPALRAVLFPTAAVIFALCFTSFAVVLTLGGGPRATILEVAIYQALRFEFDIDRAVALALVQIVLAGTLAGMIAAWARALPLEPPSGRRHERPDIASLGPRVFDGAAILLAALIFILPLAGIVLPSLAALTPERLEDPALWRAAGWSAAIALTAGLISLTIGLGLLHAVRELGPRLGLVRAAAALEGVGSIVLVTPPVLLGAGLFLALRHEIDVFASAPALVIAVNAIAVLPFVLRFLGPAMRRTAALDDRLCFSLGIDGWARWRLIDWPQLRPAAGTALGVATAMAAGDLGVIALFGSPDITTLPLLIYQRMGAYRMEDAAMGVAVLMLIAGGLIIVLERIAGGRAHA
ncbi:MAG: thiamine/thiamine pyrophosphate ABC transporter, permease protein [Rhizobiales bacterium]|nr:thiamine/thiamine pyrophosphate ABC transporter, permease protein [Hyphomicrobiales bacterium]